MKTTWVVVADSSRARIFERAGRSPLLQEIDDLVHPEGRSRGRDLASDRAGRTFDSRGHARHAKQPGHSAHEVQVEQFAMDIARRVERGRRAGGFDQMILVAGARFAGRLHRHLTEPTRALLKREVHKNLVRRPEAVIRAAIATRASA